MTIPFLTVGGLYIGGRWPDIRIQRTHVQQLWQKHIGYGCSMKPALMISPSLLSILTALKMYKLVPSLPSH